jgi:hypothetical protein
VDTISFGPDRPPRRWRPGPGWPGGRGGLAWLVVAAVAAAGLVVLAGGGTAGRRAGGPAGKTMPPLLSGVPARGVGTDLVIGGGQEWRLGAGPLPAVTGDSRPGGLIRLLRRGDGTRIGQLLPVRGGVVAVMSAGSAQHPTAPRPVLFIPARAGPARLIARASAVAIAPGGQAVWLQTAADSSTGPPSASAYPVMSPTFAVSLAGRRVSRVLRLPLGLVAVTSSGLLTDSVSTGQLQLWSLPAGRLARLHLPGHAQVTGDDSGQVIWQSGSCPVHCVLHLTGLGAGRAVTVAVPPGWWPALYQQPVAADTSGQQLVIPLDRVSSGGYLAAEDLYVIDIAARTMRQVPGGPYAIPQAPGPGDPGITLGGAWDQHGRLWVLAGWGDGYFQLGYWTGTGPLRVYPPMPGNPVAISAPAPAQAPEPVTN